MLSVDILGEEKVSKYIDKVRYTSLQHSWMHAMSIMPTYVIYYVYV